MQPSTVSKVGGQISLVVA